MAKGKSFVELEAQFDDAMATVISLYELMRSAEARSDYRHDTFRRIGRGGLSSARKAERAFHDLMEMYLDEQEEIRRYIAAPKKRSQADYVVEPVKRPPTDSMVERAVNLIDRTRTQHLKQ